ncbi:GNAT family N-acetyltransferase [Pseudonocardiaceae bacterium YIM PH 21723]|nr:GNAT family N-acetyltransferase [Pseudonocardiaceae bacterium YIM PH 21723]
MTTFREAGPGDQEAIARLYRQLNQGDPVPLGDSFTTVFTQILESPGLHLYVLEHDGVVVATTYLNVIPNLSRSARPYAIIENVVTDGSLRRTGLGRLTMAKTLEAAWAAGCYKALLQSGSDNRSAHAFYRACGFRTDTKTGFEARPQTNSAQI